MRKSGKKSKNQCLKKKAQPTKRFVHHSSTIVMMMIIIMMMLMIYLKVFNLCLIISLDILFFSIHCYLFEFFFVIYPHIFHSIVNSLMNVFIIILNDHCRHHHRWTITLYHFPLLLTTTLITMSPT